MFVTSAISQNMLGRTVNSPIYQLSAVFLKGNLYLRVMTVRIDCLRCVLSLITLFKRPISVSLSLYSIIKLQSQVNSLYADSLSIKQQLISSFILHNLQFIPRTCGFCLNGALFCFNDAISFNFGSSFLFCASWAHNLLTSQDCEAE